MQIFLNECLNLSERVESKKFHKCLIWSTHLIILPFNFAHSLPFNDSPNLMQSVFLLLKVMSKLSAYLAHI